MEMQQQTTLLKLAIALTFSNIILSKAKISTSNWSGKQLSPQQINYAAADAYAALLIYQHL